MHNTETKHTAGQANRASWLWPLVSTPTMYNNTPLTDAEEFDSKLCHPDKAVDSDFARKLEIALNHLLSVAEPMDGIETLKQACAEARRIIANVAISQPEDKSTNT